MVDYVNEVKRRLMDKAGNLSDENIVDAVKAALVVHSRYYPKSQTKSYLGGSDTYDLPTDFEYQHAHRTVIVTSEVTCDVPQYTIDHHRGQLRFNYAISCDFTLYYYVNWKLEDLDTLSGDAWHVIALMELATGMACAYLANFYGEAEEPLLGADTVDRESKVELYRGLMEKQFKLYASIMKGGGIDVKVADIMNPQNLPAWGQIEWGEDVA